MKKVFHPQAQAFHQAQTAERQILSGGGDFTLRTYWSDDCEVGQEGADFFFAHVLWVAFVVGEDVTFDPVRVSLFGAIGIMFGA